MTPQTYGQAASVAFRVTAFAEIDDTSAVLARDELPQNYRDGWEAAAQAAIDAASVPSLILKFDGKLTEEQVAEIRAALDRAVKGVKP